MATFRANYNGLRKRETYDELVDYLKGKQEVIKYPDRFAKRIREHPFLTQLDGEGLVEMEKQQENAWKEQEKEQRVKEMASKSTQSAPEISTRCRKEAGDTSWTQYFNSGTCPSKGIGGHVLDAILRLGETGRRHHGGDRRNTRGHLEARARR